MGWDVTLLVLEGMGFLLKALVLDPSTTHRGLEDGGGRADLLPASVAVPAAALPGKQQGSRQSHIKAQHGPLGAATEILITSICSSTLAAYG